MSQLQATPTHRPLWKQHEKNTASKVQLHHLLTAGICASVCVIFLSWYVSLDFRFYVQNKFMQDASHNPTSTCVHSLWSTCIQTLHMNTLPEFGLCVSNILISPKNLTVFTFDSDQWIYHRAACLPLEHLKSSGKQAAVATAWVVLFSPWDSDSACVCVTSWQNVLLETPTATGTTTALLLSTLAGVCVWTDFVSVVASQLSLEMGVIQPLCTEWEHQHVDRPRSSSGCSLTWYFYNCTVYETNQKFVLIQLSFFIFITFYIVDSYLSHQSY